MIVRIRIDGVEKKVMRTGMGTNGWERCIAINDQGLPEAEHQLPRTWFDLNCWGAIRTGGHTYELINEHPRHRRHG